MPTKVIDCQATCANIQKLIKEKGLTPTDLKEILDLVSVQSVYKWFRTARGKGNSMPSVDHVIVLAHYLNVSLDDLYITYDINYEKKHKA